MRLLVVTQVVDSNDLYLGFFHEWLREFSTRFSRIETVCLKEGTHSLPENMRVHSLGKEKLTSPAEDEGTSTVIYQSALKKLRYAVRFLTLAWKLRKEYDAVLVHMNEEYVLIGAPLFALLGKPVAMWRNHYEGSWKTELAVHGCKKIFCTSVHSFTAKYEKTALMPVGVDTKRFSPDTRIVRTPGSVLFFARLAPSKRPEFLIKALIALRTRGTPFVAAIVGSPLPKDEPYLAGLKAMVREAGLEDSITFSPGVPNSEAPDIYRAHEIYVNLGTSGMYDKTLFEAAASRCKVLAASDDWQTLAGDEFWFDGSTQGLAEKLETLLASSASVPPSVVKEHSLSMLGLRLKEQMESLRAPRSRKGTVWGILHALARVVPRAPRMTVLLYHSISNAEDFFSVRPSAFAEQIAYLKKNFAIVPLSRAFAHAAGTRVTRDSVAITSDDGYQDFLQNAVPVLKHAGAPATVFVLGNAPDRNELDNDLPLLSEEELRAVAQAGIEIGSHALSHKKLSKMPADDAKRELAESSRLIKEYLGKKPRYLAYPKGSYNKAVMGFAKEAGFEGAVSVVERGVMVGDDAYALPRIQIDSSTTPGMFRAKLSSAADWYYALWSLVKRRGGK